MALQLKTTPYTVLQVTQVNPEKTVYLDQWALQEISIRPEWRVKFKQFLIQQKAALEISWLHLLEYAQVTDQRQLKAVEDFLTDISPEHIGFIEVVPDNVIKKENQFLKNDPNATDPHLDAQLLKVFALHKRASLNPASFDGFFRNQNNQTQKMCRTFLKSLNPKLSKARKKAQIPQFNKNLKKSLPRNPKIQFLTRYLEIEIYRMLFLNSKMKMTANHWRDVLHLIVPMSYCSYVLADKTWFALGNQAEARLRKAGHKGSLASLFCNIENFFKKVT